MPGGGGPIGYVAFVAVKAAGYTGASVLLKRMYGISRQGPPSAVKMGLARTVVGIAVGVSYGLVWIYLLPRFDEMPIVYYLLLLPIRFAEWSLVLWWFLGRSTPQNSAFYLQGSALGTACSYALDVAGVFAAFVVPGGFWIC